MSNKVTISSNTGIIDAPVDVIAGGNSVVSLAKSVADLQDTVELLGEFANVPAAYQSKLTQLLENIELDSNGKIVASSSLSPQSIDKTLLGNGSVNQGNPTTGAITTFSIAPNAVTQTSLQENTNTQTIFINTTTGTTPLPPANWTWTQIANVSLTPYNVTDELFLNSFVTINVNNFYVTGSKYALTGSGTATQVADQMSIRFRDTISNTVVKEFDINLLLSDLINTGTEEIGNWAVSLQGTAFSYTIEHVFTNFSNLNLVVEFGALDMIVQYKSSQNLTISVSDVLLALTDIAR